MEMNEKIMANKNILYSQLQNKKLIYLLSTDDPVWAVNAAEVLLQNGISALEVVLRTKNALQVIEKLAITFKEEICLMAGTVLTENQYKLAVECGARYIVSPGFTENLLLISEQLAQESFYLPGAITPHEIMQLLDRNLSCFKFFPANAFNAVATLSSYLPVFKEVKFVVTGGVSLHNLSDYLKLKNVQAVGCSFKEAGSDLKLLAQTAQKYMQEILKITS